MRRQEGTTTDSSQADRPAELASDKVDLDEFLRGVEPYAGGEEFAIPGFFETDQEQAEFVVWYRSEREKELV